MPQFDFSKLPDKTDSILKGLPDQNDSPTLSVENSSQGFLSRAWDYLNKPLTTAPYDVATSMATSMTNHTLDENPLWAQVKGFGAGALEGIGNLASGMTSPISLATLGLGGAEYTADKMGLQSIARMAGMGNKVASAPFAVHGVSEIIDPNASWSDRAMGAAEMAGGAAGMIHTPVKVTKNAGFKGLMEDIKEPIDPHANQSLESFVNSVKENDKAITDFNLNRVAKNVPRETDDILANLPDKHTSMASDIPDDVVKSDVIPHPGSKTTEFLARDLQGAKPRFNIGGNSYSPQFENDLDKALYIIAQKNPSRRDADFLKFAMEQTGLDENGARAAGQTIRSQIKQIVSGAEPGEVKIPELFKKAEPNITTPEQSFKASTIYVKNPTVETIKKAADNGYIMAGKREDGAIKMTLSNETPTTPKVPDTLVESGGKPPLKPPPPNTIPEPQPASPDAIPILRRLREVEHPQAGVLRQAWNLSRGLMSVDLPFITSAGLRQGFPMIGTKSWLKAWVPSFKAYGSQAAFDAHAAMLKADPLLQRAVEPVMTKEGKQLFQNGRPVYKEVQSIAEKAGVHFGELNDLTKREEAIRGQWAEKAWMWGKHVRASNRSYTAYLNDLRLNAFRSFYNAMPDKNDMVALRALGDAVNTFTGRGKLEVSIPQSVNIFGRERAVPVIGGKSKSLERYANGLGEVLFSPRNLASRMQMLNPVNYVMAPPQARLEYLKAATRTAAAWMSFVTLAKQMGASVSLDPTNADFGKVKIGDTRIDPAAGFQQFLVLMSRIGSQKSTSSTSGNVTELGQGFKADTSGTLLQRFVENHLHPSAKYFYDAAYASENKPFGVVDRTVGLAVPMLTKDLLTLAQQDPLLIPFLAPLISGGMGSQTYGGKNDYKNPDYVPRDMDIVLGGGR